MAALREIFAEFGIQFDRRRALERGNQQVSRVAATLRRLDPIVNAVRGQLMAFAAAMGGAVMIRAVSSFIQGIIRIGDELDKTGQQVGLSTRELQAWRHAAELSGVNAGEMSNALGQLQRNALEASEGSATARRSFQRLGVELEDEQGNLRPVNELMLDVADGLAGLDSSSERTGQAMRLLGRSGRRMLPMLTGGAEGVRGLLSELDDLGGGMSDLAISESVKLNDELTRLRLVFQSLKGAVAEDVLPRVREFVSWLIDARDAMQGLAAKSHIMRAAVIAGILAVVAVLTATFPIWGLWGLAIGGAILVAVAFGLAIDDIITTAQGGDSVINRISEATGGWVQIANNLVLQLQAIIEVINNWPKAMELVAAAWARTRYAIEATVDSIIARVQRLVAVVESAANVIASLGGGGSLANLGQSLSRLTGGAAPGLTPEQRAASLAASPMAQLRVMQPGQQQRQVNNNIQAPNNVTVNVTEAQNPQATAAIARTEVESSLQRHLRNLAASLVPD